MVRLQVCETAASLGRLGVHVEGRFDEARHRFRRDTELRHGRRMDLSSFSDWICVVVGVGVAVEGHTQQITSFA